jgi:hypothetical protein
MAVHGVEFAPSALGALLPAARAPGARGGGAAASGDAPPWWASAKLSVDMRAALEACTSVNTGRVGAGAAKSGGAQRLQSFRQSASLLGVAVPPTPILVQASLNARRRRARDTRGGASARDRSVQRGGRGASATSLLSSAPAAASASAAGVGGGASTAGGASAAQQSNTARNMATLRACIDEELQHQLLPSMHEGKRDSIFGFAERCVLAEVELKYGGGLAGSIIRVETLKQQARRHVRHAVRTLWDGGFGGGSESETDGGVA